MQDNERIIELIAKGLDEPLTAQEQAQVNEAMQNSLAIRLAADGLREFDSLLKRTGMAIPEEGFPARVLARLERYERQRTRAQWLVTVGIFFLGSLAVLGWLVFNWTVLLNTLFFVGTSAAFLLLFMLTFLFAVARIVGQGPLLVYAVFALGLTVLWARVSGSWTLSITHR